MVRLLVIQRHPTGPRCWLFNQRVHHGATGISLALLFLALRRPLLAALWLALVLHDRKDWRIWFRRELLPEIIT